jgi:hypothetical protein
VSRRAAYSFLIASACLAVLATRVYLDFERIRFRVVTAARTADEPVMSVPLPDLSRLSGSPAAVILRLHGTTEPVNLTVALDATPLTRLVVAPGRELRVDLASAVPSGIGHHLVLSGGRPGWRLGYVEIANVYGFTRGTFEFLIVPRGATRTPIPIWIVVVVIVAALLIPPRLDWPSTGVRRFVYWVAVGGVLLLFAVALLADTFSQYRVLLSPAAFLLCAAVLYADPLVRAWRVAKPAVVKAFPRAARLVPHAVVVVIVLWSVVQFSRPDTGFTSLILFGQEYEHRVIPALRSIPHAVVEGAGYDGQFYAQVALDPLLRDNAFALALDGPDYRGRRILMPSAAYVLGLGHGWYVLQAYALLNVLCWLILGVVLLRWLPPGTVRPVFAWIACMLSGALLTSMRYAVPDGPMVLAIALGVAAVEQHRQGLAAAIFTLAGLTRETGILGALALPMPDRVKPLVRVALIPVPLILWMLWLRTMDFPAPTAGLNNLALPLSGYIEKWAVTGQELATHGWGSAARFSVFELVALTTQVLVLAWHRQWSNAWWRVGVAYAALMLVVGQPVWEGHPGAIVRVVAPLTIAFNVLLPSTRWFWPLWLLGNASMLHGLDLMRVPWLSGW